MRFIISILTYFMILSCSFAQFSDNFDDGNFTADPAWTGDVSEFRIENNELQLFAPDAGMSSLHVAYNLLDSLTFKQSFRMEFAPSSSNMLKLWLVATDADDDASDGLFFTLGESGSDDALVLNYQRDGSMQEVRRFGAIPHGSNLQVYWEIDWMDQNKWQVSLDYDGDGTFDELDDFEFATSFTGSQFYQIQCIYTSSRKEHFFFDDVEALPLVRDVEAPVLIDADALSRTLVRLTFDEAIQDVAGMTNLFTVNPGNITPEQVFWSPIEAQQVLLSFNPQLANNTTFSVRVDSVRDQSNNVSAEQSTEFFLLQGITPTKGQLIINEIYPAPSSSAILPNVEFIELYNPSEEILSLNQVLFSDASSQVNLPQFNLLPKSYVLLTNNGDEGLLAPFGDAIGVQNFPTLNNSGDLLTITNSVGEKLDVVDYDDSWYGEESQSGLSLERISTETNCIGRSNWGPSMDPRGGSPAEINSIFFDGEIDAELLLDHVEVVGNKSVEITFNLPVISTDLIDLINVTPSLTIDQIVPKNERLTFELVFVEDIQESQFYTLSVNPGAEACNGSVNTNSFTGDFAIPSVIESGDLIISEILYDPFSGGKEFIEIYNQSEKIVSVEGLNFLLTRGDGSTSETTLENKTPIGSKKIFCSHRGCFRYSFQIHCSISKSSHR